MKKLIAFISLLLIVNLCLANRVKTTDYYHVAGAIIDTSADGLDIAPDSVRILVYFEGAEVFDAWFNTGDAQCFAGEGNDIIFTDQYGDIDADQGAGTYYIRSQFYDTTRGIFHKASDYFELGNFGDTIQQDLSNYDGATPLTTSDKMTLVDSSAGDISYTANNQADYKATGFSTHSAGDVWTSGTRTLTVADWSTHAAADIWSVGTRTLTVADWSTHSAADVWAVGSRTITGDTYTPDINVISLDADVILATHFAQAYWTAFRDSIEEFTWEADSATYNGVSGSFGQALATPTYVQGAGADATPSEWDNSDWTLFIDSTWKADTSTYNGVAGSYGKALSEPAYVQGAAGDPWLTALPGAYGAGTAGKIVGDNVNATISSRSTFDGNLDLDNVINSYDKDDFEQDFYVSITDSIWNAILTGATYNIPTSAGRRLRQLETGQVLLTGTINTADNDSTATLGLGGIYPDDYFEHAWLVVVSTPDSVQIRSINYYVGATDSVGFAAGEKWIITPDPGDEWEIVASAGVHVVDLHQPVLDEIWNNSERTLTPRALSMATFDTASVAVFYDFGIWIDDEASNTNTIVGIDGTRSNPVSTLAAARVLADSMTLQRYYLVNNSSLTLAATHEDWEFIGVGMGNEINFGNQDVDNSNFCYLMIAGIQGGTGLIWLDRCYLDAADSLECIARNSWFSDTISVRVATNTTFDQCYSAVPGNNTPAIDFNSAGGTIGVNVRHYSGGLALFNMTSNHTISYESDGQLVIHSSCTSANVTARGNMSITDNGTTTSLTNDAVYNQGLVSDTIWHTPFASGFTAGSIGDSLTSPTYVQGEAGSLTEAGIRDAVWAKDTVEVDTVQVLKWMADNLVGVGSGVGTESCTLFVFDQDTSIIPNVDVYAYANGTGSQIGYGNTAAGGFVILNLNTGEIDIRIGTLPGHVFESNYDITVVADYTDSLFGTKLAPSEPSPGFTNVSFYTNNAGYDTLKTEFTYQLVDSMSSQFDADQILTFGSGINTMVLSRFSYTVSSDSSIFSKNLLPSPNIVVDGDSSKVFYKLTIKFPSGTTVRKDTTTISGSTYNPFE